MREAFIRPALNNALPKDTMENIKATQIEFIMLVQTSGASCLAVEASATNFDMMSYQLSSSASKCKTKQA